jgi:hypothetical protein
MDDIDREYDIGSREKHPPPKVQNFYRLFAASGEKCMMAPMSPYYRR